MYYVSRNNVGIHLVSKSEERSLNIGIKKYIDSLCMKNMSTYDGRKIAAKKILNIKSNIPIYISNKIILYPTKSIREFDTVFINYFEVLSVKQINGTMTLFTFTNLEELIVEVNIKKILKQHEKIKTILFYLDSNIII